MLYAKKMLSLLEEGKRIINIDETWLPHLDFRNKKWRRRGEPNTKVYQVAEPQGEHDCRYRHERLSVPEPYAVEH